MKKRIMKFLLATTLTLLLTVSPGWSAGAGSFASFWVQFQASVAKGDKEAIAGMTKFPFADGGRLLSKADFIKAYREIFSGTKCLAKAGSVLPELAAVPSANESACHPGGLSNPGMLCGFWIRE